MPLKSVVLEFTEGQLGEFNGIKDIVGSQRNRFLAACLVRGFKAFSSEGELPETLSVMAKLETEKIMSKAKEVNQPPKPKPQTKPKTTE